MIRMTDPRFRTDSEASFSAIASRPLSPISCGRYNAAAFGICSFLENLFQLKRVKISVFPDFTQEESAVCFRGKVRMIPLAALAAGLAILAALLVKLLPLFLRKEKKEEPHEPEESTQQNKGGVTI